MGLMRNKEVKEMVYAMALITLGAVAVSYVFPSAGTVTVCVACLLLITVFLLFTRRRYRMLARLGDYLKRVNNGDYSLELPDNYEGELSILKSEIYKVTMSLREQNQRLEQEKLRLAGALSDISHQFKTPLTSMSVMTGILSENSLEEGRRTQFTAQLRGQLERLAWLTDALLKMSRLDAEAVTFQCRPVSLWELIRKACDPLMVPMDLKDQTLSVEVEGDICCDLNWTAEALSNILKNCMEYTPAGGELSIFASTNALFTEIRVSDGGPGIDKSDLPYIFERFYRGKHAGRDSVGIGLAMAKSILQAQGASLEAKNAYGGGAEFILQFPRQNEINRC